MKQKTKKLIWPFVVIAVTCVVVATAAVFVADHESNHYNMFERFNTDPFDDPLFPDEPVKFGANTSDTINVKIGSLDLSSLITETGGVLMNDWENLTAYMNFTVESKVNKTIDLKISIRHFSDELWFYWAKIRVDGDGLSHSLLRYEYVSWTEDGARVEADDYHFDDADGVYGDGYPLGPFESKNFILSYEFDHDNAFTLSDYAFVPGTFMDGQLYQMTLYVWDGEAWAHYYFTVIT